MSNNTAPCPCLSGHNYQSCCQPLHQGTVKAQSAQQLMCSRYSAFYLGHINYLIDTLEANQRQADDEIILQQTIKQTKWLGLRLIKHRHKGNSATVEFIAFYQQDGIGQLHERSNFIKSDNTWFYVDGLQLPAVKLSRNESCLCGSGKKFKKCHGE